MTDQELYGLPRVFLVHECGFLASAYLADRGHVFGSTALAMAAELAAMSFPDLGDLDWARRDESAVVARMNDLF